MERALWVRSEGEGNQVTYACVGWIYEMNIPVRDRLRHYDRRSYRT